MGYGEDELYYAVAEKKENRILCGTVLAKLGLDLEGEAGGLYRAMIAMIVEEVRAAPEVLELAELFRATASPWLALEIPIRVTPSDRFIMDAAVRGLDALGYETSRSARIITVRHPGAPGAEQEEASSNDRRGRGRGRGR